MRTRVALLNSKVFAGKGSEHEALVIDGDRIEEMAGTGAIKIDLGGRRVIPGFVDSHSHMLRPVEHSRGESGSGQEGCRAGTGGVAVRRVAGDGGRPSTRHRRPRR